MLQKIDLAGQWTLTGPKKLSLPIPIPGDAHSALLDAQEITDPYWGENELDMQWVGKEDWEISRKIDLAPDFLAANIIFLQADSLDTLAELRINGKTAGKSNNMFVARRFDVRKYLHPGENTICFRFRSAEKAALAAAAKLPYPIPCSDAPVFSPHRNLIRKVQCHAGWDWGCCLMAVGIYHQIFLGAVQTGVIDSIKVEQKHQPHNCQVTFNVELTAAQAARSEMKIRLGDVSRTKKVKLTPGKNTLKATLSIPNPKLWWPNGLGEPTLYDLTVSVAGDEISRRIGLRKLEVVHEDDKAGRSLVVRVNDVPVFCKGANWIPSDALPRRQTPEVYKNLIESAVAANMNMLRIWGGGQYEADVFYDLCDQNGILLWHDFMFACALYPASPEFLDNVRQEAEYQVKRLQHHACLALWCGNNENFGALGWYAEPRENRDRYLADYDRLTEGVLADVVHREDPDRLFWSSSPCNGPDDYSPAWHDDSRGDMHFWEVWHSGKSFDAYYSVSPRFCSEFGYQSFPSLQTIRTYAPEDQFNVTAPVMEHHQRHPRGNSLITEMFTRYFRVPQTFAQFVYLSQVQQALAIRTAVEYWRSLRPHCMGTLYWQLNDNWPVCSWSSVEYGGKWKLLHYFARHFYAPLLTSVRQQDDKIEIWLTNDQQKSRRVRIDIQLRNFQGEILWQQQVPARAAAASSRQVWQSSVARLAQNPRESFLAILTDDGEQTIMHEHFFCEYKRCSLPEPEVSCEIQSKNGEWELVLKTKKPAFFLSLESDVAGEFSDNGFCLLPDHPRCIRFYPKKDVAMDTPPNIQITHLNAIQ